MAAIKPRLDENVLQSWHGLAVKAMANQPAAAQMLVRNDLRVPVYFWMLGCPCPTDSASREVADVMGPETETLVIFGSVSDA